MRNKRGFTLIELLAVIVILAIIALITVPIILKMLNNSRRDSAVRSAENYVDGVKKAVVNQSTDENFNPGSCDVIDDGNRLQCDDGSVLDVDVEGNKPASGTIYFSDSQVDAVQDLKFGKFYICSEDDKLVAYTEPSSARTQYWSGQVVYYNNQKFYVVDDSSSSKNYVTVIKDSPLTKEEVEKYGKDSKGNNHVNVGVNDGCGVGNTCDGKVAYYSSTKCNSSNSSKCYTSYANSDIKVIVDNWAKATISDANVKSADVEYSVDLVAANNDLKRVNGYTTRLLTDAELQTGLGMSKTSGGQGGTYSYLSSYWGSMQSGSYWTGSYYNPGGWYGTWMSTWVTEYRSGNYSSKYATYDGSYSTTSYGFTYETPDWVKENRVPFWTMSTYQDYKNKIEVVYYDAGVVVKNVYDLAYIKPILNIYKSSVSSGS